MQGTCNYYNLVYIFFIPIRKEPGLVSKALDKHREYSVSQVLYTVVNTIALIPHVYFVTVFIFTMRSSFEEGPEVKKVRFEKQPFKF